MKNPWLIVIIIAFGLLVIWFITRITPAAAKPAVTGGAGSLPATGGAFNWGNTQAGTLTKQILNGSTLTGLGNLITSIASISGGGDGGTDSGNSTTTIDVTDPNNYSTTPFNVDNSGEFTDISGIDANAGGGNSGDTSFDASSLDSGSSAFG